MKVRTYWEPKRQAWAILHNKKLIAFASLLILKNCQFRINKRERKKFLDGESKNPHAFVDGEIIGSTTAIRRRRIMYNPVLGDSFFITASGKPIFEARELLMSSDEKIYY